MSENTRDWHVTLTTPAYLSYTVEADDEESAIEHAKHQYLEGVKAYEIELDDHDLAVKTVDAYILGMY